ncbi:uncharacterized protein [Lepidochelys kempii]|uniref:uncharacterized protein isoform X1 n=2 Tax=Lepidochelys kempii TaxID=8472 RepID=UPI003C6F0E3B
MLAGLYSERGFRAAGQGPGAPLAQGPRAPVFRMALSAVGGQVPESRLPESWPCGWCCAAQSHLHAPCTKQELPQGMKDRGHNRDPKQCRVKLKELRQAYQKTREANGRSGSEPQTCRFYDELHAILGGSATTTPAVLFDSFNGDGGNTEAGFGDEEDDEEEEVVDSSQQASGETGFPDSQELFLTLDLEPVPPNPPKAASWTQQAEKGPLLHVFQ